MRVIAEGVANREQTDLIRTLGGDEIQGYLLGQPTSDPLNKIMESAGKHVPEQVPALVPKTT